VPPWATDKAVDKADNDVMSELAPLAAAPRAVLAVPLAFAPVPPLATDNIPFKVNVPEFVIGPPVKYNPNPVVPVALMLVTVPAPAAAQAGSPPDMVKTWPAVPVAKAE